MAKFFINRPIVAIVISILMVIAGLLAMAKLPIAQLPDIVPPQINVSATYTGADALTIEQSVATPLEQQMNGVDNMIYMMSTNANDGTMNLKVTYDIGTNVDIDQVNTQNRVSQASPNLPTSVNQYGVTVKKLMGLPLLVLSVYSPKGTFDSRFLGNYATININDALLRVPGVGQVTNFGTSDYAMRIWVKPDQLTKLGMTTSDLTNAVQQQSAVNPAGQIGGEPAPKGQQFTYAVRAPGRLAEAEQFGDIIVRQNPDGSTVRLKDVSRIELGSLVYQQIGRYNGKPAVIIAIYQAPGSNALEVAKQLLERDSCSVTEIAFATGFGKAGALTASFHRRYGVTPSEYRKNSKIWEALEMTAGSAVPAQRPRGLDGLRAPLVGRNVELELMDALFFHLVEAGAENAHGLLAVLDL